MSATVVFLFADTNLFLQCLPLKQLDWSPWSAFNEVNLIISSPVLREIDQLKLRGNDRPGSRARSTSSLLRQITRGEQPYLVKESDPCVKLLIKAECAPSTDLEDRLDYNERDHQLIGTVHKFAAENPDDEVCLLTHDTIPLVMAQSLGLATAMIPDNWLLPPEKSKDEKRIIKLESELTRLKNSEPQFQINCLNADGEKIEKLDYGLVSHTPLIEEQVQELMQRIEKFFPPETDFSSLETPIHGLKKRLYSPLTDADIANYHEQVYPEWLSQCEDILRHHHEALRRQSKPPVFCFSARNTGTRPARDSLVTILAKGKKFSIMPSARSNNGDDEEVAREQNNLELPLPPCAPRGIWRMTRANGIKAIRPLYQLRSALRQPLHDRNAFYYKTERDTNSRSSFRLECEQWRHEDVDEKFEGEFCIDEDVNEVCGALEFRIQAENLSTTASMCVPVYIRITRPSAYESAEKLVSRLIEKAGR
ncbi:MAG: PIN domain-containing protein [Candidatus Alcyoniella australis]|nr:PIN domain-containing protein [Candidatus Alcyoniella australis]